MDPHDYTPDQALDLLFKKLERAAPEIASQVRHAIAQGREEDVQLDVTPNKARSPKKARTYRQKVQFTVPEALDVAIGVLRAHFVEMPHFSNSAHRDFALAAVPSRWSETQVDFAQTRLLFMDEAKEIQIEALPETAFNFENQQETISLESFSEEQVRQQQSNLQLLHELTRFETE